MIWGKVRVLNLGWWDFREKIRTENRFKSAEGSTNTYRWRKQRWQEGWPIMRFASCAKRAAKRAGELQHVQKSDSGAKLGATQGNTGLNTGNGTGCCCRTSGAALVSRNVKKRGKREKRYLFFPPNKSQTHSGRNDEQFRPHHAHCLSQRPRRLQHVPCTTRWRAWVHRRRCQQHHSC